MPETPPEPSHIRQEPNADQHHDQEAHRARHSVPQMQRPAPPTIQPGKSRPQHTAQNFTAPGSHTRDATRTQHIHQEPNADQRHDQEAHRQSQADPNGPEQADQKAHLKYNPTTTHREAPESILSKRGALRARDCRPPLAAPQGRASCD